MLTGKEIAESGILTNFKEDSIQQQGIDLRVKKILKLSGMGVLPAIGKTELPIYTEIEPLLYKQKNSTERKLRGWMLPAGVYEIEFEEGLELPNNLAAKPLTRSSLVRMGVRVDSGLFDAGFKTKNMGAMLFINNTILVESGARLAQLVVFTSNDVINTYDGQFQDDKQRL